MNLKRPLFGPDDARGPSQGRDVVAIKRGLSRVENDFFPKPKGGFDGVYNRKTELAVRTLRMLQSRNKDGPFRQDDLDALWLPYMDAYARWMYRAYRVPPPPPSKEEVAFLKLVAAMKFMSDNTPGYLLGGGHGIPLDDVSASQRLDCSSSTSKALFEAGLFDDRRYAIVSGQFNQWGKPGPGEMFTVYYNDGHVFIRLHKTAWWRFDTSPHGDGGRGPKLRYLPRFTTGFGARHWPGM